MRHNRTIFRITIIIAILTIDLLLLERQVLSWGLFNLFKDDTFSRDSLDRIEAFDPDRDILFLPRLEGKDLFASISDLSICRRPEVRKHIYLYLTAKRGYLLRALEQSRRYEDTVRRIFKNNSDIPEDIALLPLLESGFNPFAVSSSKAVGLWQFVFNTSTPLGLRTDRWIDERRNIEKSTEAAIRHFRNIRGCFPDWELTLAAYNGGAGYVKRAMTAAACNDFWKLRERGLLREETSEYVPKFIALLVIHKNQRLFGIHDEINTVKQEKVEYFELRRPVPLEALARVAGVPVQTIRELNPELCGAMTPPDIIPYPINLPSSLIARLASRENELYRQGVSAVTTHRVRRGETVASIARLYKKKQK